MCPWYECPCLPISKTVIHRCTSVSINPLSTSPIKWSNTLKQFIGLCQWIIWVCLTILWSWRLKGRKLLTRLLIWIMNVWTPYYTQKLIPILEKVGTKHNNLFSWSKICFNISWKLSSFIINHQYHAHFFHDFNRRNVVSFSVTQEDDEKN